MSIVLKINDISDSVRRMQEWLNIINAPANAPARQIWLAGNITVDGNFGPRTDAALKAFQASAGLTPDGVFGQQTFTAMRTAVREKLSGLKRLIFTQVPADRCGSGFTRLRLRADVVPAYMALKKALNDCGALLGTAGGVRELVDQGRKGTSISSLHYPGLAFDLPTDAGAGNPELDAYVIEPDGLGRWRVWARCFDPTAPNFPKTMTTIENPHTYAQRRGTKKPITGHFVNFTAMANAHGFNHIPPWRGWWNPQTSPMLWEWWHFQYEVVLMPVFSTFGGEMLSVYTEQYFSQFKNVYASRNSIWRIGWNG